MKAEKARSKFDSFSKTKFGKEIIYQNILKDFGYNQLFQNHGFSLKNIKEGGFQFFEKEQKAQLIEFIMQAIEVDLRKLSSDARSQKMM